MSGPRPDTHARRTAEDDPAGLFVHGGVIPGPPTKCPNCGEPAPEAVFDGTNTNFLCHHCGTCIHIAMGYMWTVDPRSCPGCPRSPLCLSVPTWVAESLTEVRHLSDGTRVMIRPLLRSDRRELAAGFERLSERSRRLRFFSAPSRLSNGQLDYLTEIDYHNHFAWAAFALDEAGQPGVGVSRFIRLADHPDTAEAAVTVADKFQGRGLGTILLAKLAQAAIERGVAHFVAYVLAENRELLEALRDVGARVRREEPGVDRVEFDLPVSESAAAALARQFLGLLALGLRTDDPEDPSDNPRSAP